MQNSMAIPVAQHGHHIESNLQTALRMPSEESPRSSNQPILLSPGDHPVPISLHRLGAGLDFDDDQPRTVPGNEVHLQPSDPPIPSQNLPTQANDMSKGHLLAPTAEALSLCFHGSNIALSQRRPCYF